MKIKRLWMPAFFGILVTLNGCSSNESEEQLLNANLGAQQLYEKAKHSLKNGNFVGASNTLSALDSRFPFGPLSHQVQLDLIYAYYKSNRVEQALATIDRFLRLNPNHSDVDYVMYMRGLTNMESDENFFQELLFIDRADRDPSKTREAFEDFRALIEQFPNSKYSADARQRMIHIKDRLARYEISIAKFYIRREAFVAAANRSKYVIENYPDTAQVQQALEIMVQCYEELELNDLREHALKTLRLNYPDSEILS